jgi:hypothetical protein
MNNAKPKVSDESPPQQSAEQNDKQTEDDERNVSEMERNNHIGKQCVPIHGVLQDECFIRTSIDTGTTFGTRIIDHRFAVLDDNRIEGT